MEMSRRVKPDKDAATRLFLLILNPWAIATDRIASSEGISQQANAFGETPQGRIRGNWAIQGPWQEYAVGCTHRLPDFLRGNGCCSPGDAASSPLTWLAAWRMFLPRIRR